MQRQKREQMLFLQHKPASDFAMQIDLNATPPGKTGTSANLSPELAQLLAELKLSVGQKVDAKVNNIVLLTETEKQQLLAARSSERSSPEQQALLTMLRDPKIKLVELTIRDQPLTTLSNLPVTRNAQIQVLITPKGLLLLPAVAQPAGQAAPPSTLQPASTGLPAAPQNLELSPQAPPQRVQNASPNSQPPTSKAEHPPVTNQTAVSVRAFNLPIDPAAATDKSAVLRNPQLASPALSSTAGSTTSPPALTAAPPAKTLLATAVSQALPIAQPIKEILLAADASRQIIARTSPLSATAPVADLGVMLNKLSAVGLDVTKVTPDTLRHAMNASGLFYERRLVAETAEGRERQLSATPLADRDIKGLLIQLAQWSGGQQMPTALPAAQSGTDTLANLMMSLARLWTPRQPSAKSESALRQLGNAVQELAEKSLAQVQLQQFRTLNSRLQDTSGPAQWHLDIPLKLPDAYGNLYMQLFEPRVAAEEKQSDRQKKSRKAGSGRWRVFLELELEQLGALAAEVSVQEKSVEATLWSGSDDLRHRVHKELQHLRGDLERQGIEVVDLRCSANPPPEQKIRLDYALIDVKT